MRTFRLRIARAIAALLLLIAAPLAATPLLAQGERVRDPRVPPPITWCEKPAARTAWKRQRFSFLLHFASADSTEGRRILEPYLPFLLAGIAERYIAERQPSRDPADKKAKALPPGEPRYGPADVLMPSVLFDLVGNGAVDSIEVVDTTGSPLAADLKAAILAASARGNVFGPYADSSVRTRLELTVGGGEWPNFASWPAFTLYAPVNRPARSDPDNNVGGYPANGLGWDGKLQFQYRVGVDGRAVPGTVSVLGAENVVWKSERYRAAYESFKQQVERALPRMRFTPAEEHGCVVETWVQQEFVFTMKGGPAIP